MKERLQKILSGRGVTSRRRAEEWITAGRVKVNGQTAPCTLKPAESYRFHVELGLLRQELGGMPVGLQLISDYGKTLGGQC